MDFGEEFLHSPGLFPARRAGEPWGDRGLSFDLPGGPYRVTDLTRGQETALRRSFRPFLSGDGAPEPRADVRVLRAPAEDFRDMTTFREYRLDIDYQPGALRVAGLDFMALLEIGAPRLRGALWTSLEDGERFRGALENFLRLLTAYGVLGDGGVLVHSAALSRGTALLFPGRSGAGKSTLCGLAASAGYEVLGDELHAVTGDGCVEPLPFTGDLGPVSHRLAPRPLGAVAGLRHAEVDEVGPISTAAAFALLLTTTPYVNRDPYRADRLEENLTGIFRRRPALGELGFTRTSRLEVLDGLGAAVADSQEAAA